MRSVRRASFGTGSSSRRSAPSAARITCGVDVRTFSARRTGLWEFVTAATAPALPSLAMTQASSSTRPSRVGAPPTPALKALSLSSMALTAARTALTGSPVAVSSA
jgi:hypothetical protein